MLRVLILSSRYPDAVRPQLGSFVEQLALRLAARPAVDVEVVAPVAVQPFPFTWRAQNRRLAQLPSEQDWNGIRVHRPRYVVPPRMGWAAAATLERVLASMLPGLRERFPYDVLAAQFFWPEGPAAARIGRTIGVPASIKARGQDVEPARWRRSRGLILEAGRAADGLLAVSAPLRERMIALGLPAEKIAVHHTGIDRSLFACRDRAAAKAALGIEGPLLLWAGNLVARKRPLLALETLLLLPGATLLIAGSGPERRPIEARATALGIADSVRLLGPVSPMRMAQLYAAADVTLHTACSEGLSNVWIESLTAGTPIVVAELDAAKRLIAGHAAGRVVPADPAALALAVHEILTSPPAQEKVAAATAAFSWEQSASEFEKHLQALLARQ
jgi:teichuronic acid biosynthesis glycosyltransferase TuaC